MHAQRWSPGEVLRAGLVAASCVIGLAVIVNCNPGGGGGGGGGTTPTTASSAVSFKMNASGAPKCTAELRWEWEPVNVTGTSGTTTKVTVPASDFKKYDVSSTRDGDAVICLMNADGGFTSFATGDWRITLVSAQAGPVAQCQVALRAGANWAGFRQGVATCKETPAGSIGFQYP